MSHPLCPDADFIALMRKYGAAETARRLGMTERAVHQRRTRIERRNGTQIPVPHIRNTRVAKEHSARLHFDVMNGVVLVGSDAHIWPGPLTTAMRGFIKFAEELKPKLLVLNGDVMDLPQVSRHPPIGWEDHPTIADEIEAAKAVLQLIENAVPRYTKLCWTLGNHCSRFETRLATVAPEYARLHGFHLKDHFGSRWAPCWSAWVNPDSETPCVIKHRFKGGAGATRANVLNAGTHMITGHLHSANVRGLNDYRDGTRWGVDTGCLADPAAEAFVHYTEDGPLDWRSGFAVLTFKDGVLLQPELALVFSKDSIQFRGSVLRV